MKIKVGVIYGGKSVEHEISVISAVQAMNYMDEEKVNMLAESSTVWVPPLVTVRNLIL